MVPMSCRIRRARVAAGLTQSELARRLGIQRSAVTQWERTGGTSPSLGHLASIACETGVTFEWLATGRGAAQPEEGEFDIALVPDDYARDELETRILAAFRRIPGRRREATVKVVELIAP
jgi:transcriptional regulator with XRE-family HTH domain